MGILDPISIIGAVADVISSAINSSSNEEIARIQAENHRKEQNVKTIAGAAVITAGIAGLTYVASKAVEKNTSTKIATPIGSIETTSIPELENIQDVVTVDRNSIWVDRKSNQFGAILINNNTGEIQQIAYRMKSIGNKVFQIYESVNNKEYNPTGILDFNNMRMSDLGKQENGGPIFAEIAQKALGLSMR